MAHTKDEPCIPKIPQIRQQKSQILMQVLNTAFLFKQPDNKEYIVTMYFILNYATLMRHCKIHPQI